MEATAEDTKKEEKNENKAEVQSGDVVRVQSRKSSGDVPLRSDATKTGPDKEQTAQNVAKAPFANTRRQIRSLRRGVKKIWNLWSGFTKSPGSIPPRKKKKPRTLGVAGFEEIACIEVDMPDIMMTDKDKIRTSCKQCVKNPPTFPTKEQVKSKLIAADKYYGVTQLANKRNTSFDRIGNLEHEADYFDEDGKIVRPNWRFILERPLVEQYVLMTNYIRKISILSELEDTQQDLVNEEDLEVEEDVEDDSEFKKFTEKHKIDTEMFLASLKAPRKKDTAVQTTDKPSEHLVAPVSETSLYPDSRSSNESSPSKELSAVTIVTSRDFSSPFHSDLDKKAIVNSVRVKNAVKWWESKESPQPSESFPTSSDSVRNLQASNRNSKVQNEPVKDTSGSGSDGISIPIHNATGKTSIFKLNTKEKDQSLEGRMKNEKQTKHAQDSPLTEEKWTTTQKKVTFSPVVEYFHTPVRNNAVFSLPKQDEAVNETEATRELEEKMPQRLKESQNKTLLTFSSDQKHIVLKLNATSKEEKRPISITPNSEVSNTTMSTLQNYSNDYTPNTKKLEPETKIPLRPITSVQPRASSSEYQSSSSETDNTPSTLDCHSSPERKPDQLRTFGIYGQINEENKESSSNSSERIVLKPSPAMFFRPSGPNAITSLATDKFYPEVPDIDEHLIKKSYQKGMFQEERRDICSFPVTASRDIAIEGQQLKSPPTSHGLVKVVIVRGTTPHKENQTNETSVNNQLSHQYQMPSLGIGGREEHRTNTVKIDNSKSTRSEPLHKTKTKIEDVGQLRYACQMTEAATGTKQPSVYTPILNNLYEVARVPLDIVYKDSSKNHVDEVQQADLNENNEQHENYTTQMVPKIQQQKTTAYQKLQDMPEMNRSTQFLSIRREDACPLPEAIAGTNNSPINSSNIDDRHAVLQVEMNYQKPVKNIIGKCEQITYHRNTEQQSNYESMVSITKQQSTAAQSQLRRIPEMCKDGQFLSVQLEDAQQEVRARLRIGESSEQKWLLDDQHNLTQLDVDFKDALNNHTSVCEPITFPRNTKLQKNNAIMISKTDQQMIEAHREFQKIPETYSSTRVMSVLRGNAHQMLGTTQSIEKRLIDKELRTPPQEMGKPGKTGDFQPFIYPNNTEFQRNENMIPTIQLQRVAAHRDFQKIPEVYSRSQYLSVQQGDTRQESEAIVGSRQLSEHRSFLDYQHELCPVDMDKDPSEDKTVQSLPVIHPTYTAHNVQDKSIMPRSQQKTEACRDLRKIPEMNSSTQYLSVQLGDTRQESGATAGSKQFSEHRSFLDYQHEVDKVDLEKDPSKDKTVKSLPFIHPTYTEHKVQDKSIMTRSQQQKTEACWDLQKIPEINSSTQYLSVQLMKDCTVQNMPGFSRPVIEEEQSDLKRVSPSADRQEARVVVHNRNITRAENQLKGMPRVNVVTSTLTSDHIMRRISEELNYSSTEIRRDLSTPILSGVHTESDEKERDRCSYEDLYKFDVLKTSQIYSSSSSFVTPSEEQMASGLGKFDGTLFHPMLVEEITPQVSVMPSKTDSADKIAQKYSIKGANEMKTSLCSSEDQRNHQQGIEDQNPSQIQYSAQLMNERISQEETKNVENINFSTLTQIQYPQQLELLTPCYTVVGNIEYAAEDKVEIMTENLNSTVILPNEREDTKDVIESSVEFMLQKVHETIQRQGHNQGVVKNEDKLTVEPKRWLTNVIPTVIKTSTKASRQLSAHKTQLDRSSSGPPKPTDVKPVFKFLRKQKESQNND